MFVPKQIVLPAISASETIVSYIEKPSDLTPSRELGNLYINAKDEFTAQLGNRVFPILHGDAIYVPPFCEWRTVKTAPDTFGVFSLALSPELVRAFSPSLAERHTVGRARYLFDYDTQDELLALCTSLLQGDDKFAFCTIVRILSILESESLSKEKEIYEISLPLLLRKALAYIDEHIPEQINADTLASRYGVSADTVKRLFRRYLSSTVREQHLRKRTLYTAFLHGTAEDLSHAAARCGFPNKNAFLKAYLQVFFKPLQ